MMTIVVQPLMYNCSMYIYLWILIFFRGIVIMQVKWLVITAILLHSSLLTQGT